MSTIRLRNLACILACTIIASLTAAEPAWQDRADQFLKLVNASYQALARVENEAQWKAATDVKPEHDAAAEVAGQARAAFNGNPAIIKEARLLLEQKARLQPTTILQLERVLLNAAEGPMTNPALVAARIAAETRQASTLNSIVFKLNGQPITPNEIDQLLITNRNLVERQAVWEASKQSGPALKPGLIELQKLRNGVARELGHRDYFALQVAAYGMSAEEMVALQDQFMKELRPLYLQVHTWAKHELAKRYGQPVPNRIPAHWLPNRWGQEWTGIVELPGAEEGFKGRTAEWVVKTAEAFYTGLGFPKLPATFWERSDLYPLKPGETRKKNTHASCWHVDLEQDIRSLMSVEPNPGWFTTVHHELGHGYYDISYTRPEVPPLLRIGANPAFHEGMGELVSLAVGQTPYLQSVGVLPPDYLEDPVKTLLAGAMDPSVPFIFWSSGVMTHWEADVYTRNLSPDQWNARWWKYVGDFQGIEAPGPRGEEWCDAATKTHINDNPCYYYSYAIATVLKFQFHEHIARKILKQPPQSCNYAGNREVGAFLRRIMEKGGTEDWRKVLRDATGEELSTRAMVEYYRPLQTWLEEQNRGRKLGWE
jgi:peptidyl-dipeptidase A